MSKKYGIHLFYLVKEKPSSLKTMLDDQFGSAEKIEGLR